MKITILGSGTSGGVPMISCDCEVCRSYDPRDKRLRTSAMIESEGQAIVIDSGPDFRQQMLQYNVQKLDAIVFTHEHKDHTGGLDDIRAFNFSMKKAMSIYASDRVVAALHTQYNYIFSGNLYPGLPVIDLHHINNEPFEINGLPVIPIHVMHYKLPVQGFRLKNFTYITDASHIDKEEKKKIAGTEVLVINALRKAKHISHFTLDEALEMIEELKPAKAYLTHISHQMGLHEDIEKQLPDNVRLAYDGLKIYL